MSKVSIRDVVLADLKGLSVKAVRNQFQEVYRMLNGDYIYFICTGCGSWKTKESGRTKDAAVVPTCSDCSVPHPR